MRAMILAAGRGERMRPLTDHCPKPLLKAGGKPLLQWHIEALVKHGITDLVINHAHLGHQIEAFFGDGQSLGACIQYSAETTALETAGGIRKALDLLNPDQTDQPFLVLNGDVFTDWPLARALAVARQWQQQPWAARQAHVVMVPNPAHHPEGDFSVNGDVVRSQPGLGERFTFSGLGMYAPSLFNHIEPGAVAKLAPVLRAAMDAGTVSGEVHHGLWMDIGTPARLDDLNRHLSSVAEDRNTP